jgi:cytochrome c2
VSGRCLIWLVAPAALLAGCGQGQGVLRTAPPASWDASRGHTLIEFYGCGACHVIGGVTNANGHVGPPLTHFTVRYREIVGLLPTTPQNVVRWIMDPPRFVHRVDMPNLGVQRQGAQDIAAYLFRQ